LGSNAGIETSPRIAPVKQSITTTEADSSPMRRAA